LQKEANELINLAEKEVRKLTDLENNRFTAIKAEISDLDKEIENRNKNKTIKKKMEFSLLKSINAIANNRQLDETAQEIVNVGMNEFRKAGQNYSGQIVLPMEYRTIDGVISSTNTYTADTNNGGKENVPEDKLGILEPLRNKLVLVKAGATYMTGLVGDVSIPAYGGSTIGWAAENSTGSNGTGN
jgi:HK97 family phage major capsid protein